jgi:hypothetical protein
MACLLLNRVCTTRHHDHNVNHPQEFGRKRRRTWTRLRIVPIRRPSVAPLLCHRGCGPAFRPAAFMDADVRASGDQQLTILVHSHSEEEVMTTTTTAAGPTESQLRHGGTVPSPTLSKEKGERPRMVRLTVNLPSHLVEQMRDAVYWTPGLTLAWLIARAVRASLADLETIHQGPFPRRLKPLRAGRPRLVGQSMNVRPLGAGEGTDGTGKNALRPVTPVIGRN